MVQFADLRKSAYLSLMKQDDEPHKTPGQLLEALLNERSWTKRALAIVLGVSDAVVTRITKDRQPIDARLALVLEEIFDVPAERFLSLQQSFDLAQARIVSRPDPGRETRATLFGDLPVAEMIKRGWLLAENVRDQKAVESGLLKFFGANRLDDIEVLPHAAKKTVVNVAPTPAQMAWLYRVKKIAEDQIVKRFSNEALEKAIGVLKSLTIAPEEARHVPKILSEAGIRFVIVESLPTAKIDGVCFWLNDQSPVIGLSMRFDRIDNFWFVLRHELEHVRLGHGRSAIILDAELEGERAGTGAGVAEEERLANEAAQEFCVPRAKMNAFVQRKAPFFAERDLIGFSRVVKVHPGIVAGQLQRLTNRYDLFRKHLSDIRKHVAPGACVDGWGDVYPID